MLEELKAQAARLVARQREKDEAERARRRELEEMQTRRDVAAGEQAAALVGLLEEVGARGMGSVSINVAVVRQGGHAPPTKLAVYDEGGSPVPGMVYTVNDYDLADVIRPFVTFAVAWDADCREAWLEHDDTRISNEVALGIILDLIEREMNADRPVTVKAADDELPF
jgi:hypothetical protein